MSIDVSVGIDDYGLERIFIRTPYSAEFVADLKAMCVSRKWDADRRLWITSPYDALIVSSLLLKHFRHEWQHEQKKAPPPPPPPRTDDVGRYFALLCLTREAPEELVQAAQKVLARLHHPDRGGAPGRMAEINDAVDKIGYWRRTGSTRERHRHG